jgi:hypothetical protein
VGRTWLVGRSTGGCQPLPSVVASSFSPSSTQSVAARLAGWRRSIPSAAAAATTTQLGGACWTGSSLSLSLSWHATKFDQILIFDPVRGRSSLSLSLSSWHANNPTRSWFLVQVVVEDFYLEGARWRGRELCMDNLALMLDCGVLEVNPSPMLLNYLQVMFC